MLFPGQWGGFTRLGFRRITANQVRTVQGPMGGDCVSRYAFLHGGNDSVGPTTWAVAGPRGG